ncbi:MAG: hypothetical protein LC127_13820 [Chitinophagales bacterium]|nr:hypothetical protein [Chitinophagales bacterium]
MPKKEERAADKEFIETLITRISYLEGKIDTLTSQLNQVMRENERLKVELQHLKGE